MEPPSVQAPMAFESGMAGPVVRDWDGGRCSLYKCCGDCACDCEQGWGLCCATFWCSCVTFGRNARDAFGMSAVVQAVVFFVLLILPGLVYGGVNWRSTSRRTHCVLDAVHTLQAARAAHGVNDADNQAYVHEIEACKRVPIYDTLVIVFLCVHYGLMAIGLAVAAAQRVAVRKKLRLKGCCGCMPGSFCSFAGDWCLLFWCLGCALCQERRTLHRLRVKYGVVGADLAQGVDLGKAPRCAGQHSVVAASHASWAYEPEMSGHMKAAGHV